MNCGGSWADAPRRPPVLPPSLDEYVERFPGVDLSFSEGSHDFLIDTLRNGTLDLALLYDYGPDVAAHRDNPPASRRRS